MSQPDIRRYRQELKRSVRGRRLRKQLADAFEGSLAPLLEDIPSPTYEDLTEAFGPPEHLAETLSHHIDIKTMSLKTKIGLGLSLVAIVGFVGVGLFQVQNIPESGTVLASDDSRLISLCETGTYIASDNFSQDNFYWDFPQGMTTYLLEVYNTGSALTNVFVYYSDYQPPHTFEVPPGDSRAFLVTDPRFGDHSITFNSSSGTLSGSFRVLVSDEPIT